MNSIIKDRSNFLFLILGVFFITNAIIAEFIGVKIFALEDTFGWEAFDWNLFGQAGSLNFTAGVLLWPVVFIMTDVINEYYGNRGVKVLSYLAVGLISYAFIMVYGAIALSPADWWVGMNKDFGVDNMQLAFEKIFGQGLLIILGSLVAFLVGQLIDVFIFQKIKKATGDKLIWLRATGSTAVSQFIDSYIVLYIAFVGGPQLLGNVQPWGMDLFLAVGTVNYAYKLIVAILLTPAIYGAHYLIDNYLGAEKAEAMKKEAALM